MRQQFLEWVLRQQAKKMDVGADFSVETYLRRIPEYFDPAKAGDRALTVVYDFHDSGANDGAWTVKIGGGKCTLEKGEAGVPDSVFYMTAETYRRILTGKLDYSKLTYSTGAIRFFGNTLAHSEMNAYLTIPKDAGVAAL